MKTLFFIIAYAISSLALASSESERKAALEELGKLDQKYEMRVVSNPDKYYLYGLAFTLGSRVNRVSFKFENAKECLEYLEVFRRTAHPDYLKILGPKCIEREDSRPRYKEVGRGEPSAAYETL